MRLVASLAVALAMASCTNLDLKRPKCGPMGECPNGMPCSEDGICGQDFPDVQSPQCGNGVLDPEEADVDCGGACAPCEVDHHCSAGVDCASEICNSLQSRCVASLCMDSVKQDNESD